MSRGEKAAYNTIANLLSEAVAIICGLILPRLILSRFGSAYNGLTSSVSQFLSVVALMRAGVGGATRAALYKSLAENDICQISATILATEAFMRKVAALFAAFVAGFSCLYPFLVSNEFEWLFSASLVLIIAISTFVQYYFGITYQMLLQADQRSYITSLISTATVILNTILSAILILCGVGIHGVKLGSAVAFSIGPVILNRYVKKRYKLRRDVAPDYSSIRQRWDALFHQIAAFVHNNTDIMLLTAFTNTKEISVYTVYYLVANGLKKAVIAFNGGMEAAIGNMIAKKEYRTLSQSIENYELLLHMIATIAFGTAWVLILPFVSLYTKGITDADYYRPVFAACVIFTELLYLFRQPYCSIAEAAGRFKETKPFAVVQVVVNLGISILLVQRMGLVGVLIGTFCANLLQNVLYRVFVTKNFREVTFPSHIKRLMLSFGAVLIIRASAVLYMPEFFPGWLEWILYAFLTTVLSGVIVLLVNRLFYPKSFSSLWNKLKTILKKVTEQVLQRKKHK